jgi:hypothetical protein
VRRKKRIHDAYVHNQGLMDALSKKSNVSPHIMIKAMMLLTGIADTE